MILFAVFQFGCNLRCITSLLWLHLKSSKFIFFWKMGNFFSSLSGLIWKTTLTLTMISLFLHLTKIHKFFYMSQSYELSQETINFRKWCFYLWAVDFHNQRPSTSSTCMWSITGHLTVYWNFCRPYTQQVCFIYSGAWENIAKRELIDSDLDRGEAGTDGRGLASN